MSIPVTLCESCYGRCAQSALARAELSLVLQRLTADGEDQTVALVTEIMRIVQAAAVFGTWHGESLPSTRSN